MKITRAWKSAAAAACCALASGSLCFAEPTAGWQDDIGSHSLSFNLGMGVPQTKINLAPAGGSSGMRSGGPGLLANAQYLYRVDPLVSVGAEGVYFQSGDYTDNTFLPVQTVVSSYQSYLLLADVKLTAPAEGWVQPYVLGGWGLQHTVLKVGTQAGGVNQVLSSSQGGNGGFALWLRGGADFRLSDNTSFGLEAGWLRLDWSTYMVNLVGEQTTPAVALSALSLQGAFRYHFQ